MNLFIFSLQNPIDKNITISSDSNNNVNTPNEKKKDDLQKNLDNLQIEVRNNFELTSKPKLSRSISTQVEHIPINSKEEIKKI